jgi:hypothetical protein
MSEQINLDNLLVEAPGDPVNSGFRPTLYRTCAEAAFLSTAFGPDYLDAEVNRDSFLEAFKVGSH